MQAREYCKQKVAASGSSFYYSFMFLPEAQNRAITAIYAFCREVDDIVDECHDVQIAEQKLSWWMDELNRVYSGNASHPVGQELQLAVTAFALRQEWFAEVISGMLMDLRYQGYEQFTDLQLYCHKVASVVGMLAATIFGYTDQNTLEYARNLGLAFQLINIIRDVGEDARRNRVYIAEADLAQFQINPQEILQRDIKDHAQFKHLLRKYAQMARDYYARALAALPNTDRAQQRSGLIMAKIYFCILDEIERSDFAVLEQKISITALRKLWIAWRTYRTEQKICHTV